MDEVVIRKLKASKYWREIYKHDIQIMESRYRYRKSITKGGHIFPQG